MKLRFLLRRLCCPAMTIVALAGAPLGAQRHGDDDYSTSEDIHDSYDDEWFDGDEWFTDDYGFDDGRYEDDWNENGYYGDDYGQDDYDFGDNWVGYGDRDYGWGDDYYTDDWYDDEGIFNGWYD